MYTTQQQQQQQQARSRVQPKVHSQVQPKQQTQQRSKIDIANDRELRRRELDELIESIDSEQISDELQKKIDAVKEEIAALEEELEALASQPEPDDRRSLQGQQIRTVGGASTVNFSLINAIRSVVEGRSLDADTAAIIETGKSELARAGIASRGQIVIPASSRAITATGTGIDAIQTDNLDLIGPLYEELSLSRVGATFLRGLVSNVNIPIYSGTTAYWVGEVTPATEGAGTFSEETLKPKRLSAYMDISKQFIIQDSTSAEALLRNDILESIRQKLEQTILGNLDTGAGNVKPQGLFYKPAPTSVATNYTYATSYEDVLNEEMELLKRNAKAVYYLASPLGYENLRRIAKPDTTVTDNNWNLSVSKSIIDNNTVSGIPLVVSSNVYSGKETYYVNDTGPVTIDVMAGGYIVGDFSNLVVAQWGNIDLTVDPYTQAANGCVRLVVNAYFDSVLKRQTLRAVRSSLSNFSAPAKSASPQPQATGSPVKKQ
jgi:HK97 family phage major capsid protein